MNKLESKKTSKMILVLNICAAIMIIFAIFNIYTSNKYIKDLVIQGFVVSEQLSDVFKFYVNAVTPYVFYGVCSFVLGIILRKIDLLLDKDNNHLEAISYEDKEQKVEDEEDIVEMLLKENEA